MNRIDNSIVKSANLIIKDQICVTALSWSGGPTILNVPYSYNLLPGYTYRFVCRVPFKITGQSINTSATNDIAVRVTTRQAVLIDFEPNSILTTVKDFINVIAWPSDWDSGPAFTASYCKRATAGWGSGNGSISLSTFWPKFQNDFYSALRTILIDEIILIRTVPATNVLRNSIYSITINDNSGLGQIYFLDNPGVASLVSAVNFPSAFVWKAASPEQALIVPSLDATQPSSMGTISGSTDGSNADSLSAMIKFRTL